MLNIKYELASELKAKPVKGQPLGFGRITTDHMFIMNYTEGKGWHDPRIVPYQNISLAPTAMVFHYGQTMFEGLKAYRSESGDVRLFRPDMNAKRANVSNKRLCIPEIPEEDFVQAVKELVKVEKDWIPTEPGTSLYIRPFVIATDEFLGVAPSKTYLFMVILSPSGAYYASGLAPVGIWIEDDYVRAVRGGMGFAKTGGNYAASLAGQVLCCGISGSVQFAAGMKGAEKIIAINTDPNAAIFNLAHIGIVGDLYEVLPELLEKIGKKG